MYQTIQGFISIRYVYALYFIKVLIVHLAMLNKNYQKNQT